jgi:putative flippase GtrA
VKHILKQFLQREAHPIIQFIKYGICGGLATAVDVLLFYFLAWKVFPALGQNDPFARLTHLAVQVVDETVRSRHYLVNRGIAFLFSNFTVYIANRLWVFHPGRHSQWKELLLFYAVSIASFLLGTGLGWVLIAVFGLSTTLAYVANMAASVMINFAGRKHFVFKR